MNKVMGDMPAIPFEEVRSRFQGLPDKWVNHVGLTKREMMAMHMMASLTSVYWDTAQEYETSADLVKCQSETAVEMADALIAELEHTTGIALPEAIDGVW